MNFFNRKERKDFAQRAQRILKCGFQLCDLCDTFENFAVNGFLSNLITVKLLHSIISGNYILRRNF